MLNCPEWILPTLQNRFDAVEEIVENNPPIPCIRSAADECMVQLKKSLNTEQIELLNRWEDHMMDTPRGKKKISFILVGWMHPYRAQCRESPFDC